MARRFTLLLIGFLKLGCGFCLLAMILLTCADVVGRYVLKSPVFGALEMTEIFLASAIFFALPLVTLRGEHVTVDLLDAHLSPYIQSIQSRIANVICGVATGFLTWQLWLQALKLLQSGERTAQLGLQLGWLMMLLAFCAGLMGCAFLFLAVQPAARELDQQGQESTIL